MACPRGQCADVTSLRQRQVKDTPARYARSFRLDDRVVEIIVRRMRRKTMAIHVFADRPIELRVPTRCPTREMEAFLESRRDWIASTLDEIACELPRSLRYTEGETVQWLGVGYRLRLSEGRRFVSVVDDMLAVRCLHPDDPDCVRDAVEQFYRAGAIRLMPERVAQCRERFRERLPPSTLKIRKMKARWGSCSSRGEICLNSLLMQKPLAAIDFVVTHELCHLRHFAHNASFYRLMDRTLPDWREREKLLVADNATLQLDLF